jgi:hypothetical protein
MKPQPTTKYHGVPEAICPVCKKTFVPAPFHIYKDYRNKRRVCSYHCAVESERAALEKKNKKGVKKK